MVYFETVDGTVMARQAATGKVAWRIFQWDRNSTFEVINQTIYRLTCSTYKACTLEARNALNGILLWIRQLPPAGPTPFMGNSNIIYFYTSDGTLLALNPHNGNIIWQYATHTVASLNFSLTADTFTFLTPDARVHVLRNSDGAQLLTYVDASGWWEPFIQNHIIYYESDPNIILARNLNTGHTLWQYIGQGLPVSISTEKDNQVYLNVNRFQGIIALSATTGKLLWRYDATLKTSPEIQNGIVYIGLQDNTVVALRASDGSLLWRQIVSPFQYGLLSVGDILYIWQDTSIQALSLDGITRWIYLTSVPMLWYTDTNDGLLLIDYMSGPKAFDVMRASDGAILWHYP